MDRKLIMNLIRPSELFEAGMTTSTAAVPFHELEAITATSLQLHALLVHSTLRAPSQRSRFLTQTTRPVSSENFSGTEVPEVQARPKTTYFRKTPGIYHPILRS